MQPDCATDACSIVCANDSCAIRCPVGGADAHADARANARANGSAIAASHSAPDRLAHSENARPHCGAVQGAFPSDCGTEHRVALAGSVAPALSRPKQCCANAFAVVGPHAGAEATQARSFMELKPRAILIRSRWN